LFDFLQTKYC